MSLTKMMQLGSEWKEMHLSSKKLADDQEQVKISTTCHLTMKSLWKEKISEEFFKPHRINVNNFSGLYASCSLHYMSIDILKANK